MHSQDPSSALSQGVYTTWKKAAIQKQEWCC